MSKSTFKGSLLATTIIAGMVMAAPAYAQDVPPDAPPPTTPPTNTQGTGAPATPTDEFPAAGVQSSESVAVAEPTSSEEIVVTGTLIRNPNLVASAPVTVVGQEEMQLRQTNVAEEVLRTLPGQVPGTGSATNNGSNGTANINLRGLGTQRSLVLLDGVRIVPTDFFGRTDLNNIPLALVDRVDVLTGGASSVYGADAVSGVVNFITRNDFAGMELQVSDQITQRGDGNYLRADLAIGANFDDGRGNAVMNIGYQESDPVNQGFDRTDSQFARFSVCASDPACLGGSPTGTPTGVGLSTGLFQISPSGTGLVPFYAPFNFNPFNVFQTPFKRYNMYGAGHYDIADGLTVYARGLFSKNIVDTIIAPSGVFGANIDVPLSNPFLSPEQRAFICANFDTNDETAALEPISPADCAAAALATDPDDPAFLNLPLGIYRRTVEAGGRASNYTTNMFDFRAGVRGDITDSIGFDVFASRGNSERTQRTAGYVILSRFRQAVQATNTTTCIDPSNGCVPVNLFGGPGTISPASVNFFSEAGTITDKERRTTARATINGDVGFGSPWAAQPISFAVGAEYRKDYAEQKADVLAKTGQLSGFGGAVPDTIGQYDVYEGFAEVIAPIASDRPFFDELQLEAGIRRSKYTVRAPGDPVFKTTTWKVAGSWAPVPDIKFRGNYNRAVRAPNISELFAPVNTVLTGLQNDPCAGPAPTLNANLAAICLAQGAPAGRVAGGTIPDPAAGQANLTVGGNPFLRPETANTWTVGAVLRPSFLPGFNATIDYYDIKIKDSIGFPTPGDLIFACFGANPANPPAGAATNPACTGIRRNTSSGSLSGEPAQVPGLRGLTSNLGRLETAGVDVTANYRRSLGTIFNSPARINVSFNGNYTKEIIFQSSPQAAPRDCIGRYSVNCFPLQPKYSFNVRPTLTLGKVDMSVLWRWIDKMEFEPRQFEEDVAAAEADGCEDPAGADPDFCVVDVREIEAFSWFDATVRFNVNERFDMTFSVQNLFDKGPAGPLGNEVGPSSTNGGNTFPNTYDTLGRRFGMAARIKF